MSTVNKWRAHSGKLFAAWSSSIWTLVTLSGIVLLFWVGLWLWALLTIFFAASWPLAFSLLLWLDILYERQHWSDHDF